ncbi:P-loop containing nucleoside triphosphate hydrolase protein [Syncephalis fuscata]|nr:P-loop containing nucleoside triphosphate hydrolase protein [Syncephalis fuscata]
MEIFKALGAGARFNKQRFAEDVKLFERTTTLPLSSTATANNNNTNELLEEIDFFNNKPAPGTPSRRRHTRRQKDETSTDKMEVDGADSDVSEPDSNAVDTNTKPFRNEQEAEEFRTQHRIRVYGTDIPRPFQAFSELEQQFEMAPFLVDNLTKLGFKQPTPVQMQCAPVTLNGRDVMACAPTGSGKTLSFVLPILQDLNSPKKVGCRALVISPTRELSQQIYNQFQALSVGKSFKIGMMSKMSAHKQHNNPKLRPKFDILISTPLRLVHAIQQEGMDLSHVKHLVLDEADKLLDLGFLEQMDEILAACTLPQLQKALYSATLPSGVEQLAQTIMKDPIRVVVGTKNAATETIKQRLIYVGSEEGKMIAMRQLIQEGLKPPVLIFVQSIERARELFNELIYDGINVDVIHSERTRAQRDNIVKQFREGKIWVLISTELMARGIDFKGVRLVINYDFPQTVQSYIHRIGRTGRAGRTGEAVTLFTNDDVDFLRSIVNVMKTSGCDVPDWMLTLKKASKQKRHQLRRNPVERKTISTRSSYDKRKTHRKQEMIKASQKRQQQKQEEQPQQKKTGSSMSSNKNSKDNNKNTASLEPTNKKRKRTKTNKAE